MESNTTLNAAPADASLLYDSANAEGVFENAVAFIVPLPAGNICHLAIAHTEAGWIGGHKFFMRQPRNLIHNLPRVGMPTVPTRDEALALCVESALLFFNDHASVVARIADWARESLPAAVVRDLEDSLTVGRLMGKAKVVEASGGDLTARADRAPLPECSRPGVGPRFSAEPKTRPTDPTDLVPVAPAPVPPAPAEATIPPRAHYADVPLDQIALGANPRKTPRDPAKFAELVASIASPSGLLQPIALLDFGKEYLPRYEIIFGEGRFLAHQQLGRATIEAKVYSGVDSATVRAWAMVENLQREDMNAADEAEGFRDLLSYGWSEDEIAERTGKKVPTVRLALSLLKLPAEVFELMRSGELTGRQARALRRWVVAPMTGVAGGGLQPDPAFVARPEVCAIIARVAAKSAEKLSGYELSEGVPVAAIEPLRTAKLIVEIPTQYQNRVSDGPDTFRSPFDELYTFDVAGWKERKKALDAAQRAAADAAAVKVSTKAERGVSVPVVELKKSGVKPYEMTAEEEKFAEYLPEGVCVPGIREDSAEVTLCLKPELLSKLKAALQDRTAAHDAAAIRAARDRATAKLAKLRKLGVTEVVMLLEVAGTANLCEAGFERQRVVVPEHLQDPEVLQAELCEYEPVDLARAALESALVRAVGADLHHWLCWVLETETLGLAKDDAQFEATALAEIAAEFWADAAEAKA